MDLPVDRDEIILLILDFLKSQNYIKSMITLESEANVAFEDLPEEIKFFRDLIVNGDFETGLNFLELFKKAENFPYDQCVFTIKKQQFLELVENNNEEEAESLINLSREIEKLTTRDNYNELCYLLTLKKVSDHPDYANWNIYKGRMSCFNEIKHHLKQILFTTAHKEKEKVKPNSLLKLLTGLVKSIFAQNKHKIAQFFTVGQNFSFLDPAFWNFIEEQTANARLSLVSNKGKAQNPYENLSRSIDFRKGLASSQDFRDFAMQSAHFENLRSAMEGQKHENFLASADKRNQAKVSESGVFGESSQLAQSKNLQQGSERKSQNLADSSVTKKQAANLAESQKSEKKPSPQTKSPAKQQSPAQRGQYEEDFEEEDYYGKQTHEPQFTSSPQRSNVAKSKDFNKSNSGFGDQRESQNLQNVKKSLKESFSKNEEQKSMASEIRQSRFQAENISAITKKEQQSRYQYEMFSELEQIGQIQDVQPIRAASFAPDGEMFAIGTNSKSLKIYTMRPLFIPKETEYPHSIEMVFEKNNHHFGSIYSVDWSNTGRFIATGSNDKLIKVISVPDFKTDTELMELKLPGHKGIVRSIAFTLDDTRLLSGSADWSIKVWDVQEGMEIRTLQGHTSAVYCLQINGDGNLCISVGMDKCLKLWDLRAYECSVSIPMNDYAEMNYVSLSENTKNYSTIKSNEQRKTPGSITHSGNIIAAAAHMDGVVTLWDLTTRKLIEAVELHEADCRSVEFDSSSGLIATSSFDATIAIYDVNQRMVLNRITNHTDKVVFAKWHPFYPVILSTSADTTARLFAPQRFLQGLREDNEEFS